MFSLEALLSWRRDVRRFRTDPVEPERLDRLLDLADYAPSVGNSQPWRVVSVESPERRAAVIAHFHEQNEKAALRYQNAQADLYRGLKLAGLQQAPVHLAVYCDEATAQGHQLGAQTMPETRAYSVVCYIHTLWLAARADGLGLGWVSILEPDAVSTILQTPFHGRVLGEVGGGWPRGGHREPGR
ncbi:MAG: 5,6-dimethylbenzimidazole synthase, partial [Elsteraceae bacterium]